MEHGDISLDFEIPAYWDYRLFINTKHPKLFNYCVKYKLYFILDYIFKLNEEVVEEFECSNGPNIILITHRNLERLFEYVGPVKFITKMIKANKLDVSILYTNDEDILVTNPKATRPFGSNIYKSIAKRFARDFND